MIDFQKLLGSEVVEVSFTPNGIKLFFADHAINEESFINFHTLPELQFSNTEVSLSFDAPGYYDEVVRLINTRVQSVQTTDNKSLMIEFDSHCSLILAPLLLSVELTNTRLTYCDQYKNTFHW
jgi:hypothetical protein